MEFLSCFNGVLRVSYPLSGPFLEGWLREFKGMLKDFLFEDSKGVKGSLTGFKKCLRDLKFKGMVKGI